MLAGRKRGAGEDERGEYANNGAHVRHFLWLLSRWSMSVRTTRNVS